MATQVCSYTLAGMAAWACFGVDLFSSEKVRPQYEGRPQYDSDEDDVSGALSPSESRRRRRDAANEPPGDWSRY